MASSSFVYGNAPSMIHSAHQNPDQYFHESHYRSAYPAINTPQLTPPFTSQPPTPSEDALAGRKRSRGDVLGPEDDHQLDCSTPITPDTPLSRGEPAYGPGMTLVYPNDSVGHYNADATSQSGTWLESRHDVAANRPILSTRKLQRMANGPSTPATPVDAPLTPVVSDQVIVDEATRALGISWTRLDVNENCMIKQRAFTRWITRHYPWLREVELWFENTSIPGYLGRAVNTSTGVQEYYLWSYDLHQAILVTRQPQDLIFKLSQPHISLAQAAETIKADLEPVVEAGAANAAILHNDRYIADDVRMEVG